MMDDLLIVIVLYKTRLQDSLTFKTLLNSVNSVNQITLYVYDNSPVNSYEDLSLDHITVKYHNDYNNSGISKAYNAAAMYAKANSKKWLLLLDQDSHLPLDFLHNMNNAITRNKDEKLFAPILTQNELILSPCKFRFMKGSPLKKIEEGIFPLDGHSVFNSGIVVKLSEFLRVGGYNENIPLDFSDHSFIHRFKKFNKTIVVMPINIEHQLSSQSNDKDIIFRRFKQYCFGVKRYAETEGGKGWLFFWTLMRSIKLTMQFKEVKFLKVFFETKSKL